MFKDMVNESSKIRQILCADMPCFRSPGHICAYILLMHIYIYIYIYICNI